MWALAVTKLTQEFFVSSQLTSAQLDFFLPYTYEKRVITVTPPRTTSNPRPRTQHVATRIKVARWPGYIFTKIQSSEDLSTLLSVKGILALVRNGEGEPSVLYDYAMNTLRKGCAPDGLVLKQSELHSFEIGDLLRFVASSNLSGRVGKVLSIHDNGTLRLLVDNGVRASVHFSELTNDIG